MKKKIISLLLMVVLVVNVLSGCGAKKTEYFSNMKAMSEGKVGRGTSTFTFEIKDKDVVNSAESYGLVKNGALVAGVRFDYVVVDEKNATFDLSTQLGNKNEFTKLISIAVEDNMIYMSVDKLIDFANELSAGQFAQTQEQLKSMGIEKNIKFDLKKVLERMDVKAADESQKEKAKEKYNELTDKTFKALDKNFGELTAESKDYYTFNINKENADVFVKALKNFMKEDFDELADLLVEFIEDNSGSNKETSKAAVRNIKDVLSQIKKAVNESDKDITKALKEEKVDIQTKNRVGGGTTELYGDILAKEKDSSIKLGFKFITHKGKYKVNTDVKENATDVTSIILGALSGTLPAMNGAGTQSDTSAQS